MIKVMKKLAVLSISISILLGVSACSINAPNLVTPTPQIKIEEKVEPVNPLDVIPNYNPVVSRVVYNSYDEEKNFDIANLSWGNLIINDWQLQYPSGDSNLGALSTGLDLIGESKYISTQNEFLRLSLWSMDKGKTNNGSGVRNELCSNTSFELEDESSFHFQMYFTNTGLYSQEAYNKEKEAKENNQSYNQELMDHYEKVNFTIGQFLCKGTDNNLNRDLPMVMLTVKRGRYYAIIKNHPTIEDSGTTYELGTISNCTLYDVCITINNGSVQVSLLDMDNNISNSINHTFNSEFDYKWDNYFKLGCYYSGKVGQQELEQYSSFTNVYIKTMETSYSDPQIY